MHHERLSGQKFSKVDIIPKKTINVTSHEESFCHNIVAFQVKRDQVVPDGDCLFARILLQLAKYQL